MKSVKLLNVGDVAYILNGNNYAKLGRNSIRPTMIRHWIRNNYIPAIRIGHLYYIKEDDLKALIESSFVVKKMAEKATFE